jgi:hypothetical protein
MRGQKKDGEKFKCQIVNKKCGPYEPTKNIGSVKERFIQ